MSKNDHCDGDSFPFFLLPRFGMAQKADGIRLPPPLGGEIDLHLSDSSPLRFGAPSVAGPCCLGRGTTGQGGWGYRDRFRDL